MTLRATGTPRVLVRKVPEITAFFWIVKLLTTAMGEATSDYFVRHMDPVMAVVLGFVGFIISLAVQLVVRRYIAGVYWLAVTMVAVFGTMAADVVHIRFGVPYIVSSIAFGVALVATFTTWYRLEGTLSIHSIDSVRKEGFYWAAVLVTFALGTAAGDTAAYTFHLGFFASGLIFAAVIAIPAISFRVLGLSEVVAFWFAYVVTRPLGASFADWAGVPRNLGGLNFGRGTVALCLTGLIVVFVVYLSISKVDIVPEKSGAARPVESRSEADLA